MKSLLTITIFLTAVQALAENSIAKANGKICGTSGTITERIANCREIKKSKKGNVWTLVTRLPSADEVWRDDQSGYIWSDDVKDLTINGAISICSNAKSSLARGNYNGQSWNLPTDYNFEDANEHGVREILAGLKGFYWMAYRGFGADNPLWVYHADDGKWSSANKYSLQNVRCILYRY